MIAAVKDGLEGDAPKHKIPRPIVESLRSPFSKSHNLNLLAPGSAVKLIYQERVSRDGTYTLAGDVAAAQIRFGSRTLTAISFLDEHVRPHLSDELGRALRPPFLRFPLNSK